MKPLVSIIIPAYMQENYIKDTIDSVLVQTFKDFELIIINDGSTDKTGEKILEYKDPRIIYIYQKNSGRPACSRNKGIVLAKGEYIAFLDGDDIWLPDKLKKQIKYIDGENKYMMVFTNSFKFNENGSFGLYIKRNINEIFTFKDLFMRSCILPSTVMITRKCLDEVGGFNEDPILKAIEDYDLWLRIGFKYPIYYIKEPLVKYRVSEDSLGGKELDRIMREKKYSKSISKKLAVPKLLILLKNIKMDLMIIRALIRSFYVLKIKNIIRFR